MKMNSSPVLYPVNRDLTRTWFVKYNDTAGRPLKAYGQLNKLPTVAERMKEYDRILDDLTKPSRIEYTRRSTLTSSLCEALSIREHTLAKNSYHSYTAILNTFGEWYLYQYKKDKDINPALYINHLFSIRKHNNYIRKHKNVLSSLFNDIVKKGLYKENPFTDIKVRKLKSKSLFTFSRRQIELLKEEILKVDEQLYDAINFLYYLFLRPKELRLLKIENILFDQMRVSVDTTITKDKDVLLKAVPRGLEEIILRYERYPADYYIFGKGGKPGKEKLAQNSLYNRHKDILKNLGFGRGYSLYSWVHTGCKESALAGIPIKQLQLQKGHSDLKTFDEYLKNIGVSDCVALVNNFPLL